MVSPLSLALREYVPLKQGLRPMVDFFLLIQLALREYVPLKQGLRRPSVSVYASPLEYSESMFH